MIVDLGMALYRRDDPRLEQLMRELGEREAAGWPALTEQQRARLAMLLCPLVIPLAEVAELTGWSERGLRDDCNAGAIEHVNRKGTIGFTPEQVDALIRLYTRAATGDTRSKAQVEADELEEARRYNVSRRCVPARPGAGALDG